MCPWSPASPGRQHLSRWPLHQPPNISLFPFLPYRPLNSHREHSQGSARPCLSSAQIPPKTSHQSRAIPICHQNFQSLNKSPTASSSHFPTCYTLAWFQQSLDYTPTPGPLHSLFPPSEVSCCASSHTWLLLHILVSVQIHLLRPSLSPLESKWAPWPWPPFSWHLPPSDV